jgi:hypothetical protein
MPFEFTFPDGIGIFAFIRRIWPDALDVGRAELAPIDEAVCQAFEPKPGSRNRLISPGYRQRACSTYRRSHLHVVQISRSDKAAPDRYDTVQPSSHHVPCFRQKPLQYQLLQGFYLQICKME